MELGGSLLLEGIPEGSLAGQKTLNLGLGRHMSCLVLPSCGRNHLGFEEERPLALLQEGGVVILDFGKLPWESAAPDGYSVRLVP